MDRAQSMANKKAAPLRTAGRRMWALGWAWGAVVLALYGVGVGVRRHMLNAQRAQVTGQLPFTMESALAFRRVRLIYEAGRLPEIDYAVQYPEGVRPRETYNLWADYVCANLARLLPRGMSLEEKTRWVSVMWFCLSVPLMGAWLRAATGSRAAGLVASSFYAVALSSVVRSTGQELSDENFALPLLVAHLALDAWAGRSLPGGRGWLAAAGSALSLGAAAGTWDLIQFYIALWAVAGLVRSVCGGLDVPAGARWRWMLPWLGLVVLAEVHPYLRAHGWRGSPGLVMSWGVAASALVSRGRNGSRLYRLWIALAAMLLAVAASHWGAWRESYGHFAELLAAKIRFLNRKPADPSLLTFNQRILWVPALNSASWSLTRALFPALLLLTSCGIPVCYKGDRGIPRTDLAPLIFYFAAALVAYGFFVRFHVFLAVFACALLGWAAAAAARGGAWLRVTAAVSLTAGWLIEAAQAVREPWRWGRPGTYYKETGELVQWLAEHGDRQPVLANFGVSGSILAYGRCPIVLHPKFESRAVRERVEAYGRELFRGTEKSFRDWADVHGARFFVYSLGEFSDEDPTRQMRYMVEALEPPPEAPARWFEFAPWRLRYFEYLWGNRKYAVYRVITSWDERVAEEEAAAAEEALARGDLREAERRSQEALARDPHQARARDVARHASALRAQGFAYEPDEPGGNK